MNNQNLELLIYVVLPITLLLAPFWIRDHRRKKRKELAYRDMIKNTVGRVVVRARPKMSTETSEIKVKGAGLVDYLMGTDRVTRSHQLLSWPNVCANCLGPSPSKKGEASTNFSLGANRYESVSWSFPLCQKCFATEGKYLPTVEILRKPVGGSLIFTLFGFQNPEYGRMFYSHNEGSGYACSNCLSEVPIDATTCSSCSLRQPQRTAPPPVTPGKCLSCGSTVGEGISMCFECRGK